MRSEVYNSEFVVERIVVRITKLKILAAYGIFIFLNISINGFFFTFICCIGISVVSINTVSIKKIISRAMVVRIVIGIILRGFFVLSAVMSISSVFEKVKFIVIIVIKIGKLSCGN